LDKAPDAFRTISEVAEEIEVPQHVLRFWESRFAQIKPMKRGGGRRYYRPDDIDLLRGVRHLLYGEGYTIRGVQRILREQGSGFVQNVWRVGAEQPPPLLEEDLEDAADGESRREPSFPLDAGFPGATASTARRDPAAASSASGLPADDKRKLRGALDELVACRALIEAALSARD
jgi:DNA-binding transcriptional MerR regulator